MADSLYHRGPDSGGVWVDAEAGIALAHRRLAVIDLSPHGRQPMHSSSGRYTIVFNGEIYNFPELRQKLERAGAMFRGHSDTEVLLGAVDHWGFERMLEWANGMFALALWDRKRHTLRLARDRLGEKPLYYGYVGSQLLFASELKALARHPDWCGDVDLEALASELRFGYVAAPRSIYAGIYKLSPGCWVEFDRSRRPIVPTPSGQAMGPGQPARYWSLREVAEEGIRNPLPVTAEEVGEAMEPLLRAAVRRQLHSDVPLGAFLSGGIDSTTVAAIMQGESTRPIRTFTAAFTDSDFDESHHARRIAGHLGTDHTEVRVSEEEALALIPELPHYYDEPFADPSQIPTLLISRLARRSVTVCLTGDGGDELFCGYNRYHWLGASWRHLRRLPVAARQSVGRMLGALPPAFYDRLLFPRRRHGLAAPTSAGHRLHKLARVIGGEDLEAFYRRGISYWQTPGQLLGRGDGIPQVEPLQLPHQPADHMMYWDGMVYLPDDSLAKVDRASMAASLETRLPLLDRHVVEFAWRLPLATKVYKGRSKWPLRQVLYRQVPPELVERPKMGFSVPIGRWLQGPLRDWAESLLDPASLLNQGIFDPGPIRACWAQHLSGRHNRQAELWAVLMFLAWHADVKHQPVTRLEPHPTAAHAAP